ncbi:MAG: MFS transporter [Gemmataceae bacterium]|nr:MFS transporter [Gemmataceae bacterium]
MSEGRRFSKWTLAVCGMLLLATMLNYMDRQTLSLVSPDLSRELGLSNTEYGDIETAFSLAFALGSLLMGFIADRVSIRWMYPTVLIGWSLAGIATAYAQEIGAAVRPIYESEKSDLYLGLLSCRTLLGLFEAGQWPCALITTRRLLSSEDRSWGNSILQSGASVGAIATPFVAQFSMAANAGEGAWRSPFIIIGWVGMLWIVPWLLLIRKGDLDAPRDEYGRVEVGDGTGASWRRIVVLMVTVVAINITWQVFRAWLPKFLREEHKYPTTFANGFIVAYYIATDIGCLASGFLSRWLSKHGLSVHRSRLLAFSACAGLTALALPMPWMSAGPLLLGSLLLIAAGSLGLFPHYYAFTQELSARHQGKVTGFLGCFTWAATAGVQAMVGRRIDADGNYMFPLLLAGAVPLIAAATIALLWKDDEPLALSSSDAIQRIKNT